MLKRFRISNFRSLLNFEFRPVGLNLLIGPNNAGKTNLCAALRFVSLSSLASLEDAANLALGETWNLSNVYVNDQSLAFEVEAALRDGPDVLEFTYTLQLATERAKGLKQPLRVTEETLRLTGAGFSHTPLRVTFVERRV